MFSKRIVLPIMVIGCLVHFITCPPANLRNPSPARDMKVRPRGINPNQQKPALPKLNPKPNLTPAGSKNGKTTELEEETSENNRTGKLFKIFGRIKNLSKKFSPFRLTGRILKKISSNNENKSISTN